MNDKGNMKAYKDKAWQKKIETNYFIHLSVLLLIADVIVVN